MEVKIVTLLLVSSNRFSYIWGCPPSPVIVLNEGLVPDPLLKM